MGDKKITLSLECNANDIEYIVRVWQLLNFDDPQGTKTDVSLEDTVKTLWYLMDRLGDNHYFDERNLSEHVKSQLLKWHPDFFDE